MIYKLSSRHSWCCCTLQTKLTSILGQYSDSHRNFCEWFGWQLCYYVNIYHYKKLKLPNAIPTLIMTVIVQKNTPDNGLPWKEVKNRERCQTNYSFKCPQEKKVMVIMQREQRNSIKAQKYAVSHNLYILKINFYHLFPSTDFYFIIKGHPWRVIFPMKQDCSLWD